MENASDALKMAVAVFIFVLAISVAIFAFTKERQAATAILNRSNIKYYNTDNIRISNDRIVGIETVIPTLYSYFKEGYTILFYKGKVNENEELVENITPLTLYYSESDSTHLADSRLVYKEDKKYADTVKRAIYGFDVDDENTRQEPWLNDELHAKDFIKSFINNTFVDTGAPSYTFVRSKFRGSLNSVDDNKLTINFSAGNFYTEIGARSLSVATNAKFIERTGIYNEISNAYEVDDRLTLDSGIDSSVIEFSNNETIQNNEGVQKRVIQYIYIGNK